MQRRVAHSDQWEKTEAYAKAVNVLQRKDKTESTSNMEQLKRKKDAKKVV
jgi:hypothetical protein